MRKPGFPEKRVPAEGAKEAPACRRIAADRLPPKKTGDIQKRAQGSQEILPRRNLTEFLWEFGQKIFVGNLLVSHKSFKGKLQWRRNLSGVHCLASRPSTNCRAARAERPPRPKA